MVGLRREAGQYAMSTQQTTHHIAEIRRAMSEGKRVTIQ
jgi:hypothetical protein